MIKKYSLSIILILLVLPIANATTISTCQDLSTAGDTYLLSGDITDSTDNPCLNIIAENITLDCQDYMVDGAGATGSKGIITNSTNTTIKNCNVTDWTWGVFLNYSINSLVDSSYFERNTYSVLTDFANNSILNSLEIHGGTTGIVNDQTLKLTISNSLIDGSGTGIFFDMNPDHSIIENSNISNTGTALYLQYADNLTIRNNRIYDNNVGITAFKWATCDASDFTQTCNWDTNNKIYNNLFNNSDNFNPAAFINNSKWNTTKQTGNNIYDLNNPYVGGNYWTNSTGNDYSDTCTDSNTDGFCDTAYDTYNDASGCSSDNCDYLPLSNNYVESVTTSNHLYFGGMCSIASGGHFYLIG